MKKVFITESEKIKIRKMYGILKEVETITPSFVNEKTCMSCRRIELGSIKLENGTYELQKFLINAGHDIPYDGDFGIKTATALGTWVYGFKEGINTPRKLAERMKKDGWDIGTITDTPYGTQMAKEVAKLIKKICSGFSSVCKKQRDDVLKTFEERKDFNKQRHDFNPDKIPRLKKQKQFCETELNKLIPQVKQEFINWINNPKTQQKLKTFSFLPQDNLPVETIRNVINVINKNIYSCAGPYDDELFFKKEASGFYNPTLNKIKVNYEDLETDDLLITLIHETTHWIESNLPPFYRQTINRTDNVKKVYPISQKTTWETELFDNQFFSKTSIKNVPSVSIQQLQSIGISKDKVQLLIDAWNLEIKVGDVKYACSRREKEANLKSIRKLYTGSLFGELTRENLKDIILSKKNNANEYYFKICWAGNNFNPPPFEFLKLSNELAVNDNNNQDENTDKNKTINLDFSDIDPMA